LAAAVNAVYLASTDPSASPRIRETLLLADQELRRAAHITQQTLGFYREQGDPAPVAIPTLIDEILGVYARKLKDRGVTVHCRYNCGPCREGREACFVVNAGEMRQVISNLLGNGMDALRDNGKLYIRVTRMTRPDGNGQDVHLTIADNGCGIRSENLKRIFEPFFTTKDSVGTGLGLWITQELVRKHNGSIRVRSNDKGSVFRISIPAMPATCNGSMEKSAAPLAPPAAD
jgi:signal transduction histidine kinase